MNLCKQCGCEFVKKHGRQMYCEQHQPPKKRKCPDFGAKRKSRVDELISKMLKL